MTPTPPRSPRRRRRAESLEHIARHDSVSREELQEATGYKRSTSNTYVQRLATRELVVVSGSQITATELLLTG